MKRIVPETSVREFGNGSDRNEKTWTPVHKVIYYN